jgi:hypothetical protein
MRRRSRFVIWMIFGVCTAAVVIRATSLAQDAPSAASVQAAKSMGTVKSVSGKTITLAPESGGEIRVVVQEGARVLRVEPGQTDLNSAAPLDLADLQSGDRILVRGKAGDDGKSLLAASVIAMKRADIAEKHAHEREQWQRHGVGGLVTSVDAAAGTVGINTSALGANKSVTVTVSKNTVLRRYAPGSVNFDDAAPAPLDQVSVGDQLRARGTRSADGRGLVADEVVSGSFRNIAGTITAVDASGGTITVNDVATKKAVMVKIGGTTQLKKLPQPMAQRIAARLKGNSGEGPPEAGGQRERTRSASSPSGGAQAATGTGNAGVSGQAGAPGERQGGAPDLQQVLSAMPAATIADLQKGDAVMVVATSGEPGGSVNAITLLAGVEPILQASPNGGQSILTPWSLSSAPGGDAAAQ